MLKKILLVVLALMAVLLVVILMQPKDYSVVRTATINAPAEQVFGMVNDFHQWDQWSPWAHLDPNMKTEYAGPPAGVGAVYKWTGNDDVGTGMMTITESRPAELVRIRLNFQEPFASTSANQFEFIPQGQGVQVNWKMSGESDFMSKAFSLFMGGMDKAIGPDFEKGLAKMKQVAEGKSI